MYHPARLIIYCDRKLGIINARSEADADES